MQWYAVAFVLDCRTAPPLEKQLDNKVMPGLSGIGERCPAITILDIQVHADKEKLDCAAQTEVGRKVESRDVLGIFSCKTEALIRQLTHKQRLSRGFDRRSTLQESPDGRSVLSVSVSVGPPV